MSRRMGTDKATVSFNGRPLIEHVYDVVRPIFREILIISNRHRGFPGIDAPVVADVLPLQTPLVGIATALLVSKKPYVFVVACDMPYLSGEAIRYMLEKVGGEDVIMPRIPTGLEPLQAIYGRTCLAPALRLIGIGRRKIDEILPYGTTRFVDDTPVFQNNGTSVFMNINSPDQLTRASETAVK